MYSATVFISINFYKITFCSKICMQNCILPVAMKNVLFQFDYLKFGDCVNAVLLLNVNRTPANEPNKASVQQSGLYG